MSLFKDVLSKRSRKKSKSLHLTGEMIARKLQSNLHRNSFSGVGDDERRTASKNMPGTRKLSRSSSYADCEAVLLNAVAHEDVGTVKRILESDKVDLNIIRNGLAPLHHACLNGNMTIIRLLIKNNVDVNLQTKDGKTPIKLAVMNGHFELAELLISHGSKDTDIIDGVME
uniref:Uncharacterized protein n=2 Tax=Clytia hemisphaerica TaxID=252671 RepID=A0A7M5WRJ2_9CNID